MVKHKVLDWKSWLYGLGAGAIGGGANAVIGGVTINVVDPVRFNTEAGAFWQIVVTLFLANAALSAFLFLKQSPLPPVIEVDDGLES